MSHFFNMFMLADSAVGLGTPTLSLMTSVDTPSTVSFYTSGATVTFDFGDGSPLVETSVSGYTNYTYPSPSAGNNIQIWVDGSLVHFYVRSQKLIADISIFTSINDVIYLEIQGNYFTGDVDSLSNGFNRLLKLYMHTMPTLNSQLTLSGIPTLTTIYAYSCSFSGNMEIDLISLESINLSNNALGTDTVYLPLDARYLLVTNNLFAGNIPKVSTGATNWYFDSNTNIAGADPDVLLGGSTGIQFRGSDCALVQDAVDLVLNSGVANGNNSGYIWLNGGTNATPSVAGWADYDILISAGVNVLVNGTHP